MRKLFIVVIAVIVIGGLSLYFYQYGQSRIPPGLPPALPDTIPTTVPAVQSTPAADIVGGDRDDHGCIGSAGYSWCPATAKCVRVWEEGCPQSGDYAEIQAALYKKNRWPSGSVLVTVITNDGTFASGSANATTGGGGYFYAARKDSAWNIVADGNGIIDCADLHAYPDFPRKLISRCFDTITQQILVR